MTARTASLPAPFFDMAMSVLFVFIAMFFLMTFDIPKPATGAVTPKAEFLIELAWDDGSRDDIDLYARGPDGQVVFFGNRKTPLMFLDVDNVGRGNAVKQPDGTWKEVVSRRETVTIRAIQAGEYQLNVHAYRKNEPAPAKAVVTVTKINPYRVVTRAEVELTAEGEEKSVATFTVGADGEVTDVYLIPVKMVGR